MALVPSFTISLCNPETNTQPLLPRKSLSVHFRLSAIEPWHCYPWPSLLLYSQINPWNTFSVPLYLSLPSLIAPTRLILTTWQRMAFAGNNLTENETEKERERERVTMRIKYQNVINQGESGNPIERAEQVEQERDRVLIPLVIDKDCLQASVSRFRICNYLSPFLCQHVSLVNFLPYHQIFGKSKSIFEWINLLVLYSSYLRFLTFFT